MGSRSLVRGVGVLVLVLAVAGSAGAAELKITANAEGAGNGLEMNTDGTAVIQVLVTKAGRPVTNLADPTIPDIGFKYFKMTSVKRPGNSCTPRLTRVTSDLTLQSRGIYQLSVVAYGGCSSTIAPGWKPGVYVLGLKVVAPIPGSLAVDDGSTLATVHIPEISGSIGGGAGGGGGGGF